MAVCTDGRQICDADRFTNLPELEASSGVVRSYLLLLKQKPGSTPQYILKYLEQREMFEMEEIATFFGDEIFMGLTKQPSLATYVTEGGLAKLFDEKHHIESFPHMLQTSNANGKKMADPFLLRRSGQDKNKGFLFFSDTVGHQVMVSTLELKKTTDKNGETVEALEWGKPEATDLGDINDRGCNYPCVVEFQGDIYSCGACGENQTGLAIFVCKTFPTIWDVHTVVDEKAGVMHPTLVEHEGRLYLFNTRRRTNKEGKHRLGLYSDPKDPPQMDLYVSDVGDSSTWKMHPKSPVATGCDVALNGGGFIFLHNHLFRMAMDCRLYYGQAVRARLVHVLSPTDYQEEEDGLHMLSHVQASGKGFNSLGMHCVASLCMGHEDGKWVGVADGFAAPPGWELKVAES
eukprot:CAMPEP_0114522322 /NCGR_PEP_ID=MMETSP0109-20121206/20679_1 /TAXON_ID=29199 /ORGANISM="Chlorarachnion reptans, Strain CCCM449" /LENGTH=402 /DNA_ID=CAMNT_0001703529 /DNA_START=51 /DNA_END=1259 /DNA_ORIENTATION=-